MTTVRRRAGWLVVMAIPVLALAAIGGLIVTRHTTPPGRSATAPSVYHAPPAGRPVTAPAPSTATRYVGVYEAGSPRTYTPTAAFTTATGVRPGIDLYYSSWWEPFPTRWAAAVHAHGAVPFAQLIPFGHGVSLRRVSAGQYDGYLHTFAEQVRAYGHPVMIGFAPEPNGHWYTWGWQRLPASEWIAAWRHVVNVFRTQGARNVTWVWTVSRNAGRHTGPVADWWPGDSYVTWVGIDGYYALRGSTFGTVFGPTIAAVRKVTSKPVLLSETAIARSLPQRQILPSLFAGVRRDGLVGFVWFDAVSHRTQHINWQLARTPGVIAAFRRGALSLGVDASRSP